jgi:hypothetical protein
MEPVLEAISSVDLAAIIGAEDARATGYPVYVPVDAAAAAYLTHPACIQAADRATWTLTNQGKVDLINQMCPLPPIPPAK